MKRETFDAKECITYTEWYGINIVVGVMRG